MVESREEPGTVLDLSELVDQVTEQVGTEVDVPDAVVNLLETDVLLTEHGGDVDPSVRPADASVNLFDFGCIRVFQPKFVGGVIDLYNGLRTDDEALAVHAYETWGFKNISRETVRILNIWAKFVYAPIMEDRIQRIQESDSGLYGANIAHKVHHELRQAGGVTPPREFVLMDRAAIGLGSVFLRLRAETNWYQLFHDLIDGFDLEVLTKRQNDLLVRHGVPLP